MCKHWKKVDLTCYCYRLIEKHCKTFHSLLNNRFDFIKSEILQIVLGQLIDLTVFILIKRSVELKLPAAVYRLHDVKMQGCRDSCYHFTHFCCKTCALVFQRESQRNLTTETFVLINSLGKTWLCHSTIQWFLCFFIYVRIIPYVLIISRKEPLKQDINWLQNFKVEKDFTPSCNILSSALSPFYVYQTLLLLYIQCKWPRTDKEIIRLQCCPIQVKELIRKVFVNIGRKSQKFSYLK